jgi:membrane carboxypeptidase/penicillin-binding protein
LEPIGATGQIIISALLAIGQLIAPVPSEGVRKGEEIIRQSQACQNYNQKRSEYESANCSSLKDNRREYKKTCQSLENSIRETRGECSIIKTGLKVLRFKPRRLDEYMSMPNEKLVEELNTICFAAQDRIFLKPEEWQAGKLADRADFASMFAGLKAEGLQTMVENLVKEGKDGQFNVLEAYDILTDICYWDSDLKEIAKHHDYTSSFKYLNQLLSELPKFDELPDLPQASFIYDNKGTRVGEIFERDFVTRHGQRYVGKVHRRRVIDEKNIPEMLGNAFVAVEDKRFWQHNGFDFSAMQRLIYGGASGIKEGGSTFTMQIIKNVFFDSDVQSERAAGGKRSIRRKIKELLAVPMVEKDHTRQEKKKLLAYYLNLINLTPNAQGVLMASIDLFGKNNLNDLTVAEMALLAAQPKGASQYNPRRFPEEAKARRNTVLKLMAEQGYITPEESERYSQEPIVLFDHSKEEEATIFSRYYVGDLGHAFSRLKKKYSFDPRWTMGGFDVKTPLDADLQKASIKALQHGLLSYERSAGTYRYRPWIDERTKANYNIKSRVTGPKARPLLSILQNLHSANPYPETGWVIGVKSPQNRRRWFLETGETAAVEGSDAGIYDRLKDYDLVTLERQGDRYRLASGTEVQGAVAIMDIDSGEVLTLAGGFTSGPFGKYASFNRATRKFQPGSSIKPFTYLYALNKGLKPSKLISDGGVRFPKIPECAYTWTAKNYGGEGGGTMTMEHGLYQSRNHVVLNMFLDFSGVPAPGGVVDSSPASIRKLTDSLYSLYDFDVEFGLYPTREALNKSGYQGPCLPFLLGSQETSPLKMAQGYASLGNGGLRRNAILLNEVMKDDQPLLVDRSAIMRDQVFQYRNALKRGFAQAPEAFGAIDAVKPSAVALVRSLMQGVVREGTAKKISRWSNLIAGKTGTTNNSKDVWFVGFNNKISIAVHVGYDDTEKYSGLGSGTGGSLALPIFEEIMENYYKIHPAELDDPLPAPSETPTGPVQLKFDDLTS